ncbi:cysteine-rich receptor-like protein kinase 10-like protein, partial [Trifolium pratense]
KGTIVEKLNEEVAKDGQHLRHLIGICEGKLSDGREVAVKKLSQTSNQGKKKFMNEATLLARVQHKNVYERAARKATVLQMATRAAQKIEVNLFWQVENVELV